MSVFACWSVCPQLQPEQHLRGPDTWTAEHVNDPYLHTTTHTQLTHSWRIAVTFKLMRAEVAAIMDFFLTYCLSLYASLCFSHSQHPGKVTGALTMSDTVCLWRVKTSIQKKKKGEFLTTLPTRSATPLILCCELNNPEPWSGFCRQGAC